MKTIQLITHNNRPAALVAGDTAIVADTDRARVQAMCLYAMEIAAGDRPGPYNRRARRAVRRPRDRAALEQRTPRRRRGAHRRAAPA